MATKDFSTKFWIALGSIVVLCALIYEIFTSQTTDFVKEIAFTIALVGVLYLYIQFVVVGRITELEKRRKYYLRKRR